MSGFHSNVTVATPFFNNSKYTSYPLNIDMVNLVKTYKSGSQNSSSERINVYPYQFSTEPEVECKNDTRLLLLIKSAPGYTTRRNAIRETWGNEKYTPGIRRVFAMGNSRTHYRDVQNEIQIYKDILVINYTDSYYMNTWKARGALIWAGQKCSGTNHVILADDDYYVATDMLLQQLELIGSGNKPLFMGWVNPRSFPFRVKSSKWYISLSDYPYDIYPPFISAGSIVMSMDFVVDFIVASEYTKHFIFDDVFLAIVANKLGVAPLDNKFFYTGQVSYSDPRFWNTLTAHGYGLPSELRRAWKCHTLLKRYGRGVN